MPKYSMFVSFVFTPLASLSTYNSSQDIPFGEEKTRFRARIAYDGTEYRGWQYQASHQTIQGELERAMARKLNTRVRVVGASRTDAGVHARGQGVHFDVPSSQSFECRKDPQLFEFRLNQMLPRDIRISNIGEAPVGIERTIPDNVRGKIEKTEANGTTDTRPWNSIYDSNGKLYTYRICTGKVLDPMQRLYRYHEWRASRHGFSEDVLREVAAKFVGSHDFSAFTNTTRPPPGIIPPVLVNPIRTVRSVDVIAESDGLYRIEFRIDGALYRMIRNIMGTILAVSCNRLDLSVVEEYFSARDRRLIPKCAPAHGLCLEEVFYKDWDM